MFILAMKTTYTSQQGWFTVIILHFSIYVSSVQIFYLHAVYIVTYLHICSGICTYCILSKFAANNNRLFYQFIMDIQVQYLE